MKKIYLPLLLALVMAGCDFSEENQTLTPTEPAPFCGDGLVNGAEQCEPPNTATCDASCRTIEPEPICGDGKVEAPEQCDDGNTIPGDGCDELCRVEPAPRQPVSVSLSCVPLVAQPLAAECTASASSNASWYTFDWGDGQSSANRRQRTGSHVYAAPGTYTV
ncbi:MAG: DUF4215 domain-containing protein, partial [Longimicrobiales bacterium]|nr:DUF4215 domain-containing protein [Longimicrobiales bacterium]